jgi:hypothetical protein
MGLDIGLKVESTITLEKPIQELAVRKEKALKQGGEKQIAKQHALGLLTARERIEKLLDPDSFWEIGKDCGNSGQPKLPPGKRRSSTISTILLIREIPENLLPRHSRSPGVKKGV